MPSGTKYILSPSTMCRNRPAPYGCLVAQALKENMKSLLIISLIEFIFHIWMETLETWLKMHIRKMFTDLHTGLETVIFLHGL